MMVYFYIFLCVYLHYMVKPYKFQEKDTGHILQEPMASYGMNTYFELSAKSISKHYIKQIIRLTGFSVPDFISLTPISIDSYKRKDIFDPRVTEKVLEIEEVYRKGLEVFGDSFHQWMLADNVSLGGVTPKSLLQNSFGIRVLLDEIGRMEHGVLA